MGDATQPLLELCPSHEEAEALPLTSWLVAHTDILPSKASDYAALFVRNNIGNAVRLAKNVLKRPDFLSTPFPSSSEFSLTL